MTVIHKNNNTILICIVGGIILLVGLLDIVGEFVPSIKCLNEKGMYQTTKGDTIIQIEKHANCQCDTTIYVRKKPKS